MSPCKNIWAVILLTLCAGNGIAQSKWPKSIASPKGDAIKMYRPQPESFANDILKARAAVSVLVKGGADPVFGAVWMQATMQTNRSTRMVTLQKASVTEVHFPNVKDTAKLKALQHLLEQEIPKWNLSISLDQLLASLETNSTNISKDAVNTAPPEIIYKNKPATLVLIDGEPKFQENKELGVETVVNTAFIIIKEKGKLYLFGGGQWFQAGVVAGPWTIASSLPKSIKKIDKKIKEKQTAEEKEVDKDKKIVPEIVVSTQPAELIQSNGEADFAPIEGTGLLYMTNTNDDIFIDIQKQQYYVLLSGRWYRSAQLKGPWNYVGADQLPADFAKIPETSVKGSVLVSVAGTDAAREAVMDAQVPQTTKVDRSKTTTKVEYDGDPAFKPIESTTMQYAVNTKSTVLKNGSKYYCVDNGVWFEANNPNGPWAVATSRPEEVEKIPAESPVYNVKYVYVYDVTPEYVYVGYTPGYMGTYVYGPTVVYGTGMYYNPWYGPHYYPRPATYGFSMHYNPWLGWSVGFHFSTGWFNMSIYGGGYHGGYWGPAAYRPPYYRPPYYPPAYRPPVYPPSGYRPPPASRPPPGSYPARGQASQLPAYNRGGGGNLVTDRQGNVYRNNGNGWEQRQGNSWQNVNNNRQNEINSLDKQQRMQDRGNTKATQYNQQSRSVNRPSSTAAPQRRSAPVRRR